ncbi:MAG TPA: hypothetical protein VEQ59_16690, partial [Polyangiaceae bacterium]|nr:hypothetical protein [Polyangiaceae bacterium]
MKQWLVRRGLLATVPAVALVLAFGACSSEPSGSTSAPGSAEVDAPVALAKDDELATTPAAAQRFRSLAKQFQHLPPAFEEPVFQPPPGFLPPKASARPLLDAQPVLGKGDAERFVRQGSRLRAEIAAEAKQKLVRAATVDVPLKSEGRIRVQPEGARLGVEFTTEGAKAGVDVEVAEGNATFPGAGPHGGDIVLRVTAEGVEDFVVLREKPTQPRVDYSVNVGEVAGLRLYDDTLEFLDKAGDPQLHVKPPRVVDADGVKHAAKLTLLGCNADTSGEAPWVRAVTAPGAQDCTLRVSWDDRRVIYPAIVDPVWATTGSLATARYRNAAIKLSTGIVLTCGGIGDLGVAIASCEQFNPASNGGIGAWAAATSMNTARNDFTLVSLAPASATNVLAVGGTGISTSERFNGTNAWTASTGDFSAGYFYPQAPAATSDGNFVVLIDTSGPPYRFNNSTNA